MAERPPFTAPPFRAHPVFGQPHAQTILGTALPREFPFPAWEAAAEPREFVLPDGDRLTGVFHRQPGPRDPDRPVLVLLHGLEGSLDSHYVRGLSSKAFAVGYDSLRLNFRNCGGTEHLSKQLYNSTLIGDARQVLEVLAGEGHTRILIVGVSLGANLLLRLMADYGENAPHWLRGAVAICPPIDQERVSEAFGQGFNRFYDWYFLASLKRKMWSRALAHPGDREIMKMAVQAQRAWTLYDFDNTITAPASGFRDARDYYQKASSGPHLGQIRVPTLLIAAQDDPFIPFSMFEAHRAEIEGNPAITTVYSERGGHVGFFEARGLPQPAPWMDEFWAENQAVRFAQWLMES